MRGLALGLLVLMGALATARAADTTAADLAAIDKRLKTCLDQDSSNLAMKTCTGTASDAADKVLNRVYAAAKKDRGSDVDAETGKETLRRLVASERAWITYRDAECSLQGTEMLGGSGEALVVETCTYDLTVQRAKALAELFADK